MSFLGYSSLNGLQAIGNLAIRGLPTVTTAVVNAGSSVMNVLGNVFNASNTAKTGALGTGLSWKGLGAITAGGALLGAALKPTQLNIGGTVTSQEDKGFLGLGDIGDTIGDLLPLLLIFMLLQGGGMFGNRAAPTYVYASQPSGMYRTVL